MKLLGSIGLVALLVAFGTTTVHAQSLKIKQREEAQDIELAKDALETKASCGIDIPIKFNWKDAPEEEIQANSPEGLCDEALHAVRRVCEDPTGKGAVKEKVKSISCGFGPERAMNFKDGALDYTIDFKSSNDADFAYEFLQNHL
ncbi:MAG TPA: hypothetical protein VKT70_12715 [Stellaceae bacterium]|nr:hypothetical protein [Stellaceae bacterium]